mmetsp:Transcript_32554/g.79225  ORF Transcript_32554/g.79225 Transcript_32554/m.79225 type:complete len:95 (+) Transcript_32554:838-1122(+)
MQKLLINFQAVSVNFEFRRYQMRRELFFNLPSRSGRFNSCNLTRKHCLPIVKSTPWAHIDMAGPVWDTKAGASTGFGVKMLVDLVTKYLICRTD